MSLVDQTGTPAAPEDRAPVVQEPTPVAADDTPAVAAGDLFVAAEKSTPRTSGRSRSKPARVAKVIRTVIAYILLLAVLGAAGIAAFSLVQGSWMVTPVLSGSMRPGLSVGGVVVSERVTVDSLHVRDVIIFRDPFKSSEQIVHRIVKITKGPGGKLLFNTQGDANNVRDPWTLSIEGDSIYRARWSVPLVGYVAIAYQNHRGFFLLGAGILLILIALLTLFEARQGRQRRHSRRAASAP
jgi:signal peptidase I